MKDKMLLSPIEVRILGSLLEKKYTIPEYYPMSLNSITNACNQKNSREPISDYPEEAIAKCIESLRDKRLVIRLTGDGMRVSKYRELLSETLSLTRQESAVLCLLMIRGAQTSGEIRNRSLRIFEFPDLESVEKVLEDLSTREIPLASTVPGTKGRSLKYIHLFYGQPEMKAEADTVELGFKSLLEDEVKSLGEEVASLREEVRKIKRELGIE
jgi:uncharacterized protein YceH (UPF0502 family)